MLCLMLFPFKLTISRPVSGMLLVPIKIFVAFRLETFSRPCWIEELPHWRFSLFRPTFNKSEITFLLNISIEMMQLLSVSWVSGGCEIAIL